MRISNLWKIKALILKDDVQTSKNLSFTRNGEVHSAIPKNAPLFCRQRKKVTHSFVLSSMKKISFMRFLIDLVTKRENHSNQH